MTGRAVRVARDIHSVRTHFVGFRHGSASMGIDNKVDERPSTHIMRGKAGACAVAPPHSVSSWTAFVEEGIVLTFLIAQMDSVSVPNDAPMSAVHAVRVVARSSRMRYRRGELVLRSLLARFLAFVCSQTAPTTFKRVVLHSQSNVVDSEEVGARRLAVGIVRRSFCQRRERGGRYRPKLMFVSALCTHYDVFPVPVAGGSNESTVRTADRRRGPS